MLTIIKQPEIYQEGGTTNRASQKGPYAEKASETWLASSFVKTTGTGADVVLERVETDDVVIFGMSPDATHGSNTNPPDSLFGSNHYPFDVEGRIIAINVGTDTDNLLYTANGATWAGGGTGGVALAVGQQYGIRTITSGTYSGYQILTVTDTTNVVFEIVGLHPDSATTDQNPRVLVKVIPSVIQG